MTVSDDAEWTTSRIKRLLRPLKCKCLALSSYMKETPAGTTTYGSRPSLDHELLPLEAPSNIGVRIHFRKDTVQSLELSKRIYAIRDCYSDLISKMDRSRAKEDANFSTLPSLTSLCSVILGAQISCDEEEFPESECSLDISEVLYDAIPPAYRLRSLLMHALHIILDSCPPHASLYLALLDVTLEHRLYHESEVLLDVALEHAFECSQDKLPRVSNLAHRRFLVDLYCKWATRFSPFTFVRLVTGALQRAPSDAVWVSKATKRLARKLTRRDINLLPTLLSGLMDTVLICRQKSKSKQTEAGHLEAQLQEWLDMTTEACMSTMWRTSDNQIAIQSETFVEHILDDCRSWISRHRSRNNEDLPRYGFIDAIGCLYALWLVSGSRTINKHDALYALFQQTLPSSSTFTPICHEIFRTRSLDECENILQTFSYILHIHRLFQFRASLWACALYHVEEPEIEQILIDKNGQQQVRKFRLRLIERVDEAERECFAGASNAALHGSGKPRDSEIPYGDDEAAEESSAHWDWEPTVGCWFRRNEGEQVHLPGPLKRRKVTKCSYPSSGGLAPLGSPRRLRSSSGTGDSKSYHRNSKTILQSQGRGSSSTPVEDNQPPAFQFTSLLSNALSSRTSLHGECPGAKRKNYDEEVSIALSRIVDSDDSDGSWTDDDGDGDNLSVKELDYGQHAPSEDYLDLFRITGTSSPIR